MVGLCYQNLLVKLKPLSLSLLGVIVQPLVPGGGAVQTRERGEHGRNSQTYHSGFILTSAEVSYFGRKRSIRRLLETESELIVSRERMKLLGERDDGKGK
jgi:hypothetical protein